MAFRVGQKVACVDAGEHSSGIWFDEPLVQGEIYTVTAIGMCASTECHGILVAEIKQAPGLMWRQSRFRPVVSTDTGMAILEQIRRDVTNKELRPIFENEQI